MGILAGVILHEGRIYFLHLSVKKCELSLDGGVVQTPTGVPFFVVSEQWNEPQRVTRSHDPA